MNEPYSAYSTTLQAWFWMIAFIMELYSPKRGNMR